MNGPKQHTQAPGRAAAAGLAVELQAVSRQFAGGVDVLRGVDLHVPAGQFLALLGPSGCGKSTLLRVIAALDGANGGTVLVGGEPMLRREGHGQGRHPAAESLAFVFQQAYLLPWRTLLRNVELPLELKGVKKGERRDKAMALIEQVGLADAANRYPAQLSGGMQMRCSLARALITDPALLLLDEPFAALDEITRQRLDSLLYELWRARRFTVLFVTHAIAEAVFLAQRAIMFSRRPARIVVDHAVDLPEERKLDMRSSVEFNQHVIALSRALTVAEEGET